MSSALNESVRKMFKGGSIIILGLVVELGISFLAKLLIARELKVGEYGEVSFGLTVATLVSTFTILGVHRGIGRYYPRFETDREQRGVLVTGFSIVLPIACLSAVLIFLAAPFLANSVFQTPSAAPIFQIFAWMVPLMALYHLTLGTVQGMQKSAPKVIIENLAKPASRFVAVVVAITLSASAIRIAWAYLIGWVVPAILSLFYLIRYTPLFDRNIEYELIPREILFFSVPLLLSAAAAFIYNDIDTLMLGYYRSSSAVGIYNVVYPLANLLTVALTGFSFLCMPLISEQHAKNNLAEFRRLYQVGTKWVVVATLPLFLVVFLFPEMTISVTFGNKYRAGSTTLSILAVGFFVHTLMGLNSAVLTSTGHTRLLMFVNVGAAVLNFVLNFVLIPNLGYLGAGLATTASYVGLNLTLSYFLYQKYQLTPLTRKVAYPLIVGTTLVAVVYTLVRLFLPITFVSLIVMFLIFVLLYTVAIFRLGGIEAEEIMLLNSVEERFDLNLGWLKTAMRVLMGVDELPKH